MKLVFLALYLAAMAGLWWWLFSMDASDDYAGWVPAVVGAQLPAALALRRAPPTFGLARALALAIPAGVASAATVFLLAVRLSTVQRWEGLGWMLGIMGWATLSIPVLVTVYARILVRSPGGAARVLRTVSAAGALAIVTAASFGGAAPGDGLGRSILVGLWIVAALPLAFVLPLWLAWSNVARVAPDLPPPAR